MYIKVRVTAGVKRESIEKLSDDHFKIGVKEPAQKNRANKRVIELLAEYFRVPVHRVRIVNGHHHPSKLISIDV